MLFKWKFSASAGRVAMVTTEERKYKYKWKEHSVVSIWAILSTTVIPVCAVNQQGHAWSRLPGRRDVLPMPRGGAFRLTRAGEQEDAFRAIHSPSAIPASSAKRLHCTRWLQTRDPGIHGKCQVLVWAEFAFEQRRRKLSSKQGFQRVQSVRLPLLRQGYAR